MIDYKLQLGDDYKLSFVDFKDLQVKKYFDNDKQIYRKVLTGNLILYSDDFDYINTLHQNNLSIDIICLLSGSDVATGTLLLDGRYDYDSKIVTLQVIENDAYTTILQNYSIEQNIIEITDKYSVFSEIDVNFLEFSDVPFTENLGLGSKWNPIGYAYDTYARESRVFSDVERDILIGSDGWELKQGTTNTLIRDWTGHYQTFDPITQSATFKYFTSPQTINTVINSKFVVIGNTGPFAGYYHVHTVNNDLYYGNTSVTYRNCRKLSDVIEFLVNRADSSLTCEINLPTYLENCMISGISDVILESDNTQKTEPSVKGMLSLEKLMNYLAEFHSIYWYIDSLGVFKTIYYTDIVTNTQTNANNNLTTYKGINWTEKANIVETKWDEKQSIIRFKTIAGQADFIGTELIFPNIKTVKVEEIQTNDFFTDIQDTIENKSKYSDTSVNQFFLFASDKNNDNILTQFINYSCDTINGESADPQQIFSKDFSETVNIQVYNPTTNGTLYTNKIYVSVGDLISFYFKLNDTTLNALQYVSILYNSGGYSSNYIFFDSNTFFNVTELIQYAGYIEMWIQFKPSATTFELSDFFINNVNLYNVRKATGIITGNTVQNVEMSAGNLLYGVKSKLPDSYVKFNGNYYTFDSERMQKFDFLKELKVPFKTLDEITETEYFTTDYSENCILDEVTKNLDGDFATIKLKI